MQMNTLDEHTLFTCRYQPISFVMVIFLITAIFRYYVATAQNYNNQLFNKKEAKLNLASLKITISNLYKTNITNDYLYFDYV